MMRASAAKRKLLCLCPARLWKVVNKLCETRWIVPNGKSDARKPSLPDEGIGRRHVFEGVTRGKVKTKSKAK